MSTLTGTIDELLTPRLLGSLAARSGVPDTTVKTGISGAIASILDGLVGKANDSRAMDQVTDLIGRAPESVDVDALLDESGSLHRTGEQLLGVATPDTSSLASRLSTFLGIGKSAATGLLGAAAGIAMAGLRKVSRAKGGLDAHALASSLIIEKSAIHAAVPPGLAMPRVGKVHVPVERKPNRTWMWLIPLALLALWGVMRMRRHDQVQPAPTSGVSRPPANKPIEAPAVTPIEPADHESEQSAIPAAPTQPPPVAEPPVAAPTPAPPPAAELSFPAGTAEAAFLAHVKSPTGSDETKWFELTEVQYETGSAAIRPGATEQLAHIADVMKANPMIRIKVGGYTDATGDAAANEKLSGARAESVREALVADGVAADRIETEGYGDQHQRDQTSGSAQANRRAAIRVLAR